jgi:predicted O-methyltransferase YrrM
MNIERNEAWFTEASIIEFERFLNTNTNLKIFEFGMGASTIWLSKFPSISLLVSVEHDKNWFHEVGEQIKNTERTGGCGLNLSERPYDYCIKSYDDDFFDCVIVDGRDRVKCLESAKSKIKPNGLLILDNSERTEYVSGIELYSGWERQDFKQPLPDKYGFTYPDWTTTFFKKPL